eukprot:3149648-Prymnesium_polylepis.1
MCKAWVLHGSRALPPRLRGPYVRYVQNTSRVTQLSSAGLACLDRSTDAGNTDPLNRGASATR